MFEAVGEAITLIETLGFVVSVCNWIAYFEFEDISSCKVFIRGINYLSSVPPITESSLSSRVKDERVERI